MARPRIGERPLTAAERQARRRARLAAEASAVPAGAATRTVRKLPRPQRWRMAVAALVDLQQEYQDWLDRMPESLLDSALGEKLAAIAELDLGDLAAIDPPLGFGRD